jgi:four helix bundle protein
LSEVIEPYIMIPLEKLEVYKVAMEIGDLVWAIVEKWSAFAKDTLGKQFVRSADSIGLNIAEGYGRYFYKENKNFCFYSRGSAKETGSALKKAIKRNLITQEENDLIERKLISYYKLVNGYIKSIGSTKSVEESNNDQ